MKKRIGVVIILVVIILVIVIGVFVIMRNKKIKQLNQEAQEYYEELESYEDDTRNFAQEWRSNVEELYDSLIADSPEAALADYLEVDINNIECTYEWYDNLLEVEVYVCICDGARYFVSDVEGEWYIEADPDNDYILEELEELVDEDNSDLDIEEPDDSDTVTEDVN